VDPNWKPTPGWYRSDPEGKTTELETEAQEAQDRLVEVTGVGAKPPPQRGQHYVSRKVFENKPLREDTRRVFEDAASGPLSDPTVNLYSKPHREYNRAVDEAFENFLAERGIESKNMTPAQARDFLHGVLRSNDPRIHDFNMRIFEQRYLHRKSIFGTEEPDDD
jgi:hypothetical protein